MEKHTQSKKRKVSTNDTAALIYGMAFIGAAIYYIQQATSFWGYVLAILKALVWPAILTYKVLVFLYS